MINPRLPFISPVPVAMRSPSFCWLWSEGLGQFAPRFKPLAGRKRRLRRASRTASAPALSLDKSVEAGIRVLSAVAGEGRDAAPTILTPAANLDNLTGFGALRLVTEASIQLANIAIKQYATRKTSNAFRSVGGI
jgi:hypothetical protein